MIGVNVSSKMLDRLLNESLNHIMASNESVVLVVDEAANIVTSSLKEVRTIFLIREMYLKNKLQN